MQHPGETRFHEMSDGRRIAFRHAPGAGPALVFLPGYRSDMTGTKATAIFEWAVAAGREALLCDYSGCGASSGDFAEGTLSRWRDEVLALIDAYIARPAIVIGSSMGGWLMLLVAERLGSGLHGLMGIAAAPDFTDWGRSDDDKARLAAGETVWEDSPAGYDPVPFHAGFWHDGQSNRRLGGPIALDCPVRLVHGIRDTSVPWEVSQRLLAALRSPDIHLTLVKDADHNMSREGDIALLLRTIESM